MTFHTKLFKRIFKAKIVNNITNQFLLYGFSHIIPFLLMPFLIATIGIEKYGLVNFVLAFSFYFQVVNEWGFDLSNVRHVVANRKDVNRLSYIFTCILSCKGLLVACSLTIYSIIVIAVPEFRKEWPIYLIAFIRLVGIVLTPFWLFRSMEDLKYVTRISLIVETACILPVFIIVREPSDYIWVMIAFMMQTICQSLCAIHIAFKRYKLHLCKVTIKDIIFFFKDSLPFFTSTFLQKSYTTTNTFVLGTFCGASTAGIYTASEKLYSAYSSLLSPLLSQVFYPYFQRVKDFIRINKMVAAICGLNFLFVIIMFVLAPYAVPMFIKEETTTILSYFNIFLFMLLISVPNDILGFPYLGVMGHVSKVNFATMCAAVLYFAIIITVILSSKISIATLIYALIAANMTSLLIRAYYIHRYKSC